MTDSQFDAAAISVYVSSYAPRLLPAPVWAQLRPEVERLLLTIAPGTRELAKGYLASLCRFLHDTAAGQTVSLDLLTAENIERFTARSLVAGMHTGTLGQHRPKLRALLAAREGVTRDRAATRPRVTPWNPYSDAELARVRVAVDDALAMGDTMPRRAVELIAGHGLTRDALRSARLDGGHLVNGEGGAEDESLPTSGPTSRPLAADDPLLALAGHGGDLSVSRQEWDAVRGVVEAACGVSLRMHRLRHGWLGRVLTRPVPLAVSMTRYGLSRDDLAVVRPGLPGPTEAGADALHAM
jgi:hypothetical protein